MFKKALTSFQRPSTHILRGSFRLQSTVSDASTGAKTMTSEDSSPKNYETLSQEEVMNSGSLLDSHQSFTVFPSIENVKPEELVGGASFGFKTYFVERSSTGNLPVYSEYKRNGKVVTEIRKIQGDPIQLRNDLQERLPHISKKAFKVIMQSKKIVIEGDAVRDVKHVLSTTF